MQKGGLLRFLAPLSKSGLTLLKSVIKPLGMLGFTAAASAADAGIHKKILGSCNHTTLIISNDDLKDFLKVVKLLENNGILLEEITKTVKNEVKEEKGGFLSILLSAHGSFLVTSMVTGKGIKEKELEKEQLEPAMDLRGLFEFPPINKF